METGHVIGLFILIIGVLLVGAYLFSDEPDDEIYGGIVDTVIPQKETIIYTAPATGIYQIESGTNVTFKHSSTKDKVFYHKELDRIIDGNELELLGDL